MKRLTGWACLLALFFSLRLWAFPVQIADAPSNNLPLLLSAIQGANQSLLINIYEFTDSAIADAVVERILAGVHVEILQEGSPVGGLSTAAKGIQSRIISAMTQMRNGDRYFEMKKQGSIKRRYVFDHAKYLIVDGQSLYVTSENFSPNGHPQPGSLGNRGWDAFVHEPAITAEFQSLFDQDTDVSFGDILSHVTRESEASRFDLGTLFTFELPQAAKDWLASPRSAPAQTSGPMAGLPSLNADAVEKISSPDSSLTGLLDLIQQAQISIDLEQMNLHENWATAGKRSPLFDALVAAANRGVQVRVLLNDESVFGGGSPEKGSKPSKNLEAVNDLNTIATPQLGKPLPLEAAIADLKAMKVSIIHNKGALIDGKKVLISSINWNENSVTNNRETAVVLTSSAAYDYFENLFESDWSFRRRTGSKVSQNQGKSKSEGGSP